MIETAEIINFQSHPHTVIDFHKRVNVIKGTSHHGKSSIVRALKWALFNKPRGEGFKSHFAKAREPVEVGISFADQSWIQRIRDNENRYIAEDLSLKALRTDVPDEIKAITHIDEINFQSQGDPFFLIGETAGQAGKKLNEIVGLEIIDEVRARINQKISKLKLKSDMVDDDLKQTKESLKEYKHVDKAVGLVNKIEKLNEKNKELSLRSYNTFFIVDQIKTNQKDMDDLSEWLQVEDQYSSLNTQYQKLKNLQSNKDKIFWWKEEIDNQQIAIEEIKDIVSLEPDLKKLKEMQKKVLYKQSTVSKLSDICSAIRKSEKVRENAQETLKIDLKRQSELQKQLEYCQYCGSERKYWKKR